MTVDGASPAVGMGSPHHFVKPFKRSTENRPAPSGSSGHQAHQTAAATVGSSAAKAGLKKAGAAGCQCFRREIFPLFLAGKYDEKKEEKSITDS